MRLNGKRRAALLLSAIASGVTIVGFASSGAFAGNASPATSGPVASVQWRDASAYSVLVSPDSDARPLKAKPTSNPALNDALRRATSLGALEAIDGESAAAFIGEDGPCLLVYGDDGGRQACAGPTSTEPPAVSDGQSWVVGLAPDGINRVTLRLADGRTQSATVTNNVYAARVAGQLADERGVSLPGFDESAGR